VTRVTRSVVPLVTRARDLGRGPAVRVRAGRRASRIARHMRVSRVALLLVPGLAACHASPQPARVAHDTVATQAVPAPPAATDSGLGAGPAALGYLHPLVLGHGSTADTSRDLWVSDTPGVAGDSVQFGIAYDSAGRPKALYRYATRRHLLERAAVPSDLHPALSDFAFSPDGHYLAYVRFPGDQTGQGVVRRWPSGAVVLETAAIRVPISDAMTGAAAWSERDRFELFIMPDSSDGAHWVRFRGTIPGGVVSVDTLSTSR
jgi:hypothetical protein